MLNQKPNDVRNPPQEIFYQWEIRRSISTHPRESARFDRFAVAASTERVGWWAERRFHHPPAYDECAISLVHLGESAQYQHPRESALVFDRFAVAASTERVGWWAERRIHHRASLGELSDAKTTAAARIHECASSRSPLSARALNTRARALVSTVSPWQRRRSASAGGPSDGSTTGHHWASPQIATYSLPACIHASSSSVVRPDQELSRSREGACGDGFSVLGVG